MAMALIGGEEYLQTRKGEDRWWAFGKVGPIECLHSNDGTEEERKEARRSGEAKRNQDLAEKEATEKLLGKLRIKYWNLMGKDKVMELIEKFIDLDYAPVEVSTRYGISGVKVWISYSKIKGDVPYPKRTKYSKYRKGRCSRHCKPDGTQLGFGRYGTKSCRAGSLSDRAIEAARRAIIGHFHRAMSGQLQGNCKIWVRVLANFPITRKPTEVRMGRGKGNPMGWVARVSMGQILFEMDDVSFSNARQAATLAAHKPSLST
ncbi:hypothetical protein M9H77_27044 [Catharanthus roseus]|uniref:Uncharacterized protein n=1 Tax=Catharanthus roseus TaxID=4058 RepID=A0ACC0ACE5_CATRO|nr:hypothetical protein M9H77_27044 [Catharanthus roseus]